MGIGDIYPVVLTIALVAILIAIVLFMLGEFGKTWKDREFETITNETLDAVFAAANQSVDGIVSCEANTFVVTVVHNASGDVIGTGNYTAYNDGNVINLTTTYPYLWNVSYTYYHGGTPCEATEDIATDFVDFIPWIGVILLIVAAAIVLGILMRSFSGGGRV